MGKFYRNDTDGLLKAAALQAAVDFRDPGSSEAQILETAEIFYEWVKFIYDDGMNHQATERPPT